MWIYVITPLLTMLVGFLLGVITTDSFKTDQRMDRMERKINRMERAYERAYV